MADRERSRHDRKARQLCPTLPQMKRNAPSARSFLRKGSFQMIASIRPRSWRRSPRVAPELLTSNAKHPAPAGKRLIGVWRVQTDPVEPGLRRIRRWTFADLHNGAIGRKADMKHDDVGGHFLLLYARSQTRTQAV